MTGNKIRYINHYLLMLALAFATSLVLSCTRNSDEAKQLLIAKSIMEQQPDSALLVLNQMKHNLNASSFSPDIMAYWIVYYCYSLDKSYKDLEDDIPIEEAVKYFSNKDVSPEKMYSFYYLGKIQYGHNEYAKSINSFISAIEIAQQLNDLFNLALIHRSIGDIYTIIHNETEALKHYTLAFQYFENTKGHSNKYAHYTLVDIAHAYNNIQDYNKSIKFAKEALNEALKNSDTTLIANSLEVLGCSYCGSNQYEKAISTYNKIVELTGTLSFNEIRNLSLACVRNNQLTPAKDVVVKFIDNDSLRNLALYDYNREMGNYKDALLALDIDVSIQNKILQEALTQNVTGAVSDYYSYETRIKESEANKHKLVWISVLLASSFVIIGLWVYFRMSIKKKKDLIEQNMQTAENLRQILEIKNSTLVSAQDTISKLFANQFRLIDELCSDYYECKGTSKEKNKVYERVVNLISGLGSNPDIINQMEEKINQGLDNLISNFRKDYTELKDSDIQLFIYLIMGFSPRAISVLISQKIEVVYNRKSSLKRKIKEGNSTQKELYLRYFA